ncbi:hypothetical protein [Nocardioides marmoriginsengisoli]|nr:hypothetical protein [Nocardioides marmoriginsengisoli]
MATTTIDIATTSVNDVQKALGAAGARITDKQVTPGACGYTTITIVTKSA